MAKGRLQAPAYTPYIVADVTAAPWPVSSAEHTAALAKWKVGRATAGQKQSACPQSLPLNAWVLYRMRFILTAEPEKGMISPPFFRDICGAWSSFGGIAAQFNHLSIVLRLATTENIESALLYDSLLSAHLEELARARAERSAETLDFAQLISVEQTRFKLQAVAQAAKTAPPADKKEKEKVQKDTPVAPKADWLPKKEYLAKMAAGRKAAAAGAAANAAARSARVAADRPADHPPRSARRSRSRRGSSRSNHQRASPKHEPMRRRRR